MAKAGDKKIRYTSNTYDAVLGSEVTVDGETAERLVSNGHAVYVTVEKKSDAS